MSTLLEPEARTDPVNQQSAAERMRVQFAACRIRFKWFGTSKSLTTEQKSQAAKSFGADIKAIRAGKKLIDTSHEAFKSLTSLKSQIVKLWKDNSLPYPEPGIRLIRHEKINELNQQFQSLKQQLDAGVEVLDRSFQELLEGARERLGSLFDATDYPASLLDEFDFEWEFPSVEPPNYLQSLHPSVYEQQARRVSARFEQAVEMAEQAFMEELEQLVGHLSERLTGNEDGQSKVFRDSAVSAFSDFFQRFRQLNVHSSDGLDELVARCEQLMSGVNPQGLRTSESLRQQIASNLASVQSSLDTLITDRPRRNILRRPR
jgi:hypothetical protein